MTLAGELLRHWAEQNDPELPDEEKCCFILAERAAKELYRLTRALQRIADIDQDYDAKLVGHYLLKKKCKIIAKEALAESV